MGESRRPIMHCALRLVLLVALLSTASLAFAEPLETEHGHVSSQVPEQVLLEANSEEDTSPTPTPTPTPTASGSGYTTSSNGECEDYTTSNGSEWHDSGGEEYNCQWYSYNSSQADDAYGDHHCESYGDSYEYDGYTGDEACCTCGGGTGTTDSPTATDSPTEAPTVATSAGTSNPTSEPTTADGCSDYTTSNGSEWHDSGGEEYNCQWYSYNSTQTGDSYGDHHCESYGDSYEYDGYTGDEACCTCGGGTGTTDSPTEAPTARASEATTVGDTSHPTYAPSASVDTPTEAPTKEPSSCEDNKGSGGTTWHDSQGESYSCDWYSEGDNCATYGDQYENDGYTANQACCTCQSTGEPTVAPTEELTDAPTAASTNEPTLAPTDAPTDTPTRSPSEEPTVAPTDAQTDAPSSAPSEEPTVAPTKH